MPRMTILKLRRDQESTYIACKAAGLTEGASLLFAMAFDLFVSGVQTQKKVSEYVNVSEAAVMRHMKVLTDKGLVRRTSYRSYVINPSWRSQLSLLTARKSREMRGDFFKRRRN